MTAQKTSRFCSGVARRVGGGFGNPILIALMPVITQLLTNIVSNMKCFKPKPDVPPEPIPAQLQQMWQADREQVIRRLIPAVRSAAFSAGRRECEAKKQRFRRSDYVLNDDDARALALAHVHEALGLRPIDANDIVGYVQTQFGNEPIVE